MWLNSTANASSYDSTTGEGSVGVEFAGTAVSSPSPYGQNISLTSANNFSRILVEANPELQWQEVYYRGYFELHVSQEAVLAQFFGMPTLTTRNSSVFLSCTENSLLDSLPMLHFGGRSLAISSMTITDPTLNRNEIPLANFTVAAGANRLSRPVGGGVVENGALKSGVRKMTNATNDTSVAGGRWFVSHAGLEDI